MSSILERIFEDKQIEVARAKEAVTHDELTKKVENLSAPLAFDAALRNPKKPAPRLIAEIKYRSPSKGDLGNHYDPVELAELYARNGASAVSVLTDTDHFGGSPEYLSHVYAAGFGIPLLRKDFIFDEYQLLEARAAGASAVLLITAMLSPARLDSLLDETCALGMQAIVEVHTQGEFEQAVESGAKVVGINNRDLHTFEVNLEISFKLAEEKPEGVILVSESGIQSPQQAASLAQAGIDAILVGEALVKAEDTEEMVAQMSGMVMR